MKPSPGRARASQACGKEYSGRGAVFIDRPRFDESAKATLGFISLPMRDGATVVGVVTVGVIAEKLPAQ